MKEVTITLLVVLILVVINFLQIRFGGFNPLNDITYEHITYSETLMKLGITFLDKVKNTSCHAVIGICIEEA